MDYLYIVSLATGVSTSLSFSRILAGKLVRSSNSSLYLSLLLGIDALDKSDTSTLSICICTITVLANLTLFYIDPLIQVCLALIMLYFVIDRILRIRRNIKNIIKLVSLTQHTCDIHPEITRAICMEDDGSLLLVCPKCDSEVAEDFGVTIGDCLDKNNKNME